MAVSTHASLAGCDQSRLCHRQYQQQFLLTHPLRDATRSGHAEDLLLSFYSRIPRGMRRMPMILEVKAKKFLLTHPSRDAT